MALELDPDRRRKLMALAHLHDEWQRRHGIDDVDFTPDGADDSDNRRSPTLEQEWEFERRAREIFGQDPETGRYRD